MKRFYLFFVTCLCLAACAHEQKQTFVPAIIHQVKQEAPVVAPSRPANIIGAIEPFYILPMKSAFYARVDTGAMTSSIDVENLSRFERDGEKWVSFDVVNNRSNETYHFEKPLLKRVKIKRIGQEEHRLKVMMDIKLGGTKIKTPFTLAERAEFEYQGLLGRSVLTGRYLVDTSLEYTLK
ncbi:MAG: ATP-dependent zinc protease [Alphaproteobacteria bacterium]|nr:ATP-dependent zinc protease [Alphaproteobacteria bacterium]MBR6327273.1 ATP-dependent zinc protease [Alphaproteobacteria bacterium]